MVRSLFDDQRELAYDRREITSLRRERDALRERVAALEHQLRGRELSADAGAEDPAGEGGSGWGVPDIARSIGNATKEAADHAGKSVKHAGKQIGDAVKKGADAATRRQGTKKDFTDEDADAERERMDGFETFRIELCMEREDLLEHEDCLEWMSKKCPEETSGKGLCMKFFEMVRSKCLQENRYCQYFDRMKSMGGDRYEIHGVVPAVAGAPGAAPGAAIPAAPAPGAVPPSPPEPEPPTPPPATAGSPMSYGTMDEKTGAPAQGYNEFRDDSDLVWHDDQKTYISDWQEELSQADMTKDQMYKKICEEQPHHLYCKLWLESHGKGSKTWGGNGKIGEEGWFNKKVVEPVMT